MPEARRRSKTGRAAGIRPPLRSEREPQGAAHGDPERGRAAPGREVVEDRERPRVGVCPGENGRLSVSKVPSLDRCGGRRSFDNGQPRSGVQGSHRGIR